MYTKQLSNDIFSFQHSASSFLTVISVAFKLLSLSNEVVRTTYGIFPKFVFIIFEIWAIHS